MNSSLWFSINSKIVPNCNTLVERCDFVVDDDDDGNSNLGN